MKMPAYTMYESSLHLNAMLIIMEQFRTTFKMVHILHLFYEILLDFEQLHYIEKK